MSTRENTDRLEWLQGTLDMLILRTLIFGPQHGQGIARAIQQTSEGELLVEHGALYPALQRLEDRGLIDAEWGTSSNNRRAGVRLKPAGLAANFRIQIGVPRTAKDGPEITRRCM